MNFETIKKLNFSDLSSASLYLASEKIRTVLHDSKEIIDLLKTAKISEVPFVIQAGNQKIQKTLTSLDKETNAMGFGSKSDSVLDSNSLLVTFSIFNEFYAFNSKLVNTAENFQIQIPTEINRIHQRGLDRTLLSKEDQFSIKIREINGQRSFIGVVQNLSTLGLGIEILEKSENGKRKHGSITDLDQSVVVSIEFPDNEIGRKIPGRITHWKMNELDQSIYLGISCTFPIAQGDEHSLEDYLLERRYPDVFRARSVLDYERVWKMLQSLDKVIHVDSSKKDSSIVTWKKTSWSHKPLHRIYLLNNQEDPEKIHGTLSVSRFYSKTWLLHQLAVDGTKGQALSHQLYGRALDFLRQTEEVGYTIGTWPKEVNVFKRYYVEFIENDPAEYHYLEPCLILEYPVQEAKAELEKANISNDITIEPFNYRVQKDVLQFLRSKYPSVFLESLNLSEYQMLLEDVQKNYGRVGLKRSREILLALSKDKKILGFSIVEYGSNNQNIFSLFDNFRIFSLIDDPNFSYQIKTKLLLETMKIYSKVGIGRAISWTNDLDLEKCVTNCERTLDAYFWVANAVRMKAFLRHLDRLHGRISIIRSSRNFKTH